MRTGTIHFAKLESSPRLQRLLAVLTDAGERGMTTLEIIQRTQLCAINSAACELRKNGYTVTCFPEGRSPQGSALYRYRLQGAA